MTTTRTGTATATVRIDAPAEVIYDLITDVTRMGEWSPECVGAEVPADTPVAPGFAFTGRNRRGDQEWTTPCEVVAADRPHLFSFTSGDADSPTTWSYELRSLDEARTEVTESFDSTPLRDPATAAQLEGRHEQLHRDLTTTLEALKSVAERDNDR